MCAEQLWSARSSRFGVSYKKTGTKSEEGASKQALPISFSNALQLSSNKHFPLSVWSFSSTSLLFTYCCRGGSAVFVRGSVLPWWDKNSCLKKTNISYISFVQLFSFQLVCHLCPPPVSLYCHLPLCKIHSCNVRFKFRYAMSASARQRWMYE